jgi:hypothetical protein
MSVVLALYCFLYFYTETSFSLAVTVVEPLLSLSFLSTTAASNFRLRSALPLTTLSLPQYYLYLSCNFNTLTSADDTPSCRGGCLVR